MQTHCIPGESDRIEELVGSLTEALKSMAWKYGKSEQDREDLVSVATVALMEAIRFHRLLEVDNPRAYALVTAENAMRGQHDRGHADLLRRPTRKDMATCVEVTPVVSLDAPFGDEKNGCLYDVLASEPAACVPCCREDAVRAAFSRLTKVYQCAVGHRYELAGYGRQSFLEQARTLGVSRHVISGRLRNGLKRLRRDTELCAVVGVEVQA
jgi:DNA-directed RNA polymerase specialized sigma24 family protein